MLEIVKNPFLLQQPGNEIEVRFAVLDAVFHGLVRTLGVVPEIAEAPVPKDLLYDVGNALILKDTAIGKEMQKPDPRRHLDLVGGQAVIAGPKEFHAPDIAVNVTNLIVQQDDGQHHRLLQKPNDVDVRALSQYSQYVVVGRGNALGTDEALEQQRIIPERALQPEWAVDLSPSQSNSFNETAGAAFRRARPVRGPGLTAGAASSGTHLTCSPKNT